MARRPAAIEVDERLLEALTRAAADEGVDPGELVEAALRRYFGLRGFTVMDDLRDASTDEALSDDEAMAMAV
jgi:hypothetical protein